MVCRIKLYEGREVLTAAQREELWLEGIVNYLRRNTDRSVSQLLKKLGNTQSIMQHPIQALSTGYGGVAGYNAWRE